MSERDQRQDQARAPLFEALLRHHRKSRGNFHVPGHKQRSVFDLEGNSWFQTVLQLDLTEVGELDDLHDPRGVIVEAQRLAAEAFQAEQTLFLVGGTTAGNLAAILHLCRPGDTIIVQRSCHQSVFHGCFLAGAKPVYLTACVDKQTGLELPVDPVEIQMLLKQYPTAKAVVITSPSYFGIVQPLSFIAEICHHYGVPLVVDEAHGAHFGFHPELPPSAMQCHADVAIQSTHKMLTSMTMSSMLHVKGNRVNVDEIKHWLRMIESSSPSYPLMASLDLSRRYVVQLGLSQFDKILSALKYFRGNIDSFRHVFEVYSPGIQDPLKMCLRATDGITGYQIAEWLEQRGYYTELADHEKVLFVFSLAASESEFEGLYEVLSELDRAIPEMKPHETVVFPDFPAAGQAERSYDEIKRGLRSFIPLEEAVGQISTEMIVPYPPGIPLVLPGEPFSREMVEYLMAVIRLNGKVRGVFQSFSPHVYVLQ
ncbi:aminotransferase class I/II-fold pyridoxal phosphate-dependent enzyme [Paenactinomyces guangxiensis]|uniref:Aminotransferase class I/II-fold pyridoxal phosphate-dependent enzyme n=1 Tax=Paenactinomyces guangxiensis TaxID=1490290 RepID=A0A7W2AA48_9BACL|nr:aminotransferase class I/II-fold pyridoxal phosphate-dependent enzyme [Paenactinomyces guangxiensis]MBA4495844.1 aminotransferase class I/II-fold pyridoxal phosphate-dependent enzyme [Paenactinomyces guangxiensis]MBH8592934.1 aminotransferase class I/II-fold pyridoxal phosphate-dependent enzyme [Paenactinomyces guangxiensis]